MTLTELKAQIAEALEIDPSALDDTSSSETIATWDSIAALRIISILDDAIEGELTAEEAESLVSIGAILELARKRGIISQES